MFCIGGGALTDDWYVKARQKGGNPRSIKLGRCDVIGVSQARSLARKVLADLAAGINPNAQRQQQIIEESKVTQLEMARSITLRQALDECLALKDYKPKSRQDMISMFQRNFSDWLDRPIRLITRGDVLGRFAEIKLAWQIGATTHKRKELILVCPLGGIKALMGRVKHKKHFVTFRL